MIFPFIYTNGKVKVNKGKQNQRTLVKFCKCILVTSFQLVITGYWGHLDFLWVAKIPRNAPATLYPSHV